MFPVNHGPFLVLVLQKYPTIQEDSWVLWFSRTYAAFSHWNDNRDGLAMSTGNLDAVMPQNLKTPHKNPGIHALPLFVCQIQEANR